MITDAQANGSMLTMSGLRSGYGGKPVLQGVELTVERATLNKMNPYPWIDLKVVSGDSGEEWPGIYHIEGDTPSLAFATTRPTKLESPKVNMDGLFTRPSAVSKVITLVREPEK